MRAWSLRARLTALSTAVTALVLAATAALLLAQLRSGLMQGVDAVALGRARDGAALVQGGRLSALADLPAAGEVVVQVVAPGGRVLASTPNAAGLGRLFDFGPAPRARTASQVVLRGDTLDYRVVTARAGTALVYAGAPVDDVRDGVTVLAAGLAAGGPVLLALLALGCWLVLGRALRPVEVLRLQAAAVTTADLSRRATVPRAPELARLAVTLNDLLDRVDRASRQQRRFIGDASHELRNPVATLLASLEVHERTSDHPDAPELRRQAQRLSDLVNDLLALARIESGGHVAPVRVELAELVGLELYGRRGVETDLAPAWVLADPGLLRRALTNLVDNALRHAERSVCVAVAPEGDEVLLVVSDDGPGVPAVDRERIFERFTRLDEARGRQAGGSGLGLSIVAEAVASCGGRVAVNDAGPGARFVVRLPRLR